MKAPIMPMPPAANMPIEEEEEEGDENVESSLVVS